jgi:hypothetical protein
MNTQEKNMPLKILTYLTEYFNVRGKIFSENKKSNYTICTSTNN